MMRAEGVMKKGHIQLNKNIIIELSGLHLKLLQSCREPVYHANYYKTLPYIVQLRAKAGGEDVPEIETCFTALYGYLALKMQNRDISEETVEGMRQIALFLSLLAEKYKEDKLGALSFDE